MVPFLSTSAYKTMQVINKAHSNTKISVLYRLKISDHKVLVGNIDYIATNIMAAGYCDHLAII